MCRWDDVECISNCCTLGELALDGNPLAMAVDYRAALLCRMHQLSVLDQKAITVGVVGWGVALGHFLFCRKKSGLVQCLICRQAPMMGEEKAVNRRYRMGRRVSYLYVHSLSVLLPRNTRRG